MVRNDLKKNKKKVRDWYLGIKTIFNHIKEKIIGVKNNLG